MDHILAVIGLFSGMITSRVELVGSRSKIEKKNAVLVVISFLSMISTFGLLIWGFYFLDWWQPILAFLGLSIIIAGVINRSTFAFFFSLSPLTGLVTIALALIVWL